MKAIGMKEGGYRLIVIAIENDYHLIMGNGGSKIDMANSIISNAKKFIDQQKKKENGMR